MSDRRTAADLSAELREEAGKSVCNVSMCSVSLLSDAAAAIDAQAAEIARQQRIIDGYARIYNDAMTALRDVVAERDRLQREKTTDALMIERLAEPAQETAETWNALQRSLAEIERLRAACTNARDMLSTDRQAFVDSNRLRDGRTDDPIAYGLNLVDEDTWITAEDAECVRDYDRAIALIDAALTPQKEQG